MSRLAKCQLIGPVALFSAILAAEAAVYALALAPTSEFLWYVNLQIFGSLQKTHYALSRLFDIAYLQLICVALPILALAVAGLSMRRQLLLAISSNLSFVFAAFLVYSCHGNLPQPRAASLSIIAVPSGSDFYLFLFLLAASSISFVISHIIYLRQCTCESSPAIPTNVDWLQRLLIQCGAGKGAIRSRPSATDRIRLIQGE